MGTNDVILKRTVPVDVDSARLASVSHFVLALYTRGRRRAEDDSAPNRRENEGCVHARARQAGPGCLSLRRERRDCRTRARARSALAHLLEGAAVGSAKRARLRPERRAAAPSPARPSRRAAIRRRRAPALTAFATLLLAVSAPVASAQSYSYSYSTRPSRSRRRRRREPDADADAYPGPAVSRRPRRRRISLSPTVCSPTDNGATDTYGDGCAGPGRHSGMVGRHRLHLQQLLETFSCCDDLSTRTRSRHRPCKRWPSRAPPVHRPHRHTRRYKLPDCSIVGTPWITTGTALLSTAVIIARGWYDDSDFSAADVLRLRRWAFFQQPPHRRFRRCPPPARRSRATTRRVYTPALHGDPRLRLRPDAAPHAPTMEQPTAPFHRPVRPTTTTGTSPRKTCGAAIAAAVVDVAPPVVIAVTLTVVMACADCELGCLLGARAFGGAERGVDRGGERLAPLAPEAEWDLIAGGGYTRERGGKRRTMGERLGL